MKRREFCRNTLAASLAASYPFLAGCGRDAPAPSAPAATAAKAESGIPAIALDGRSIELEKAAIRELGQACTGEILLAGQPGYDNARKVWNGMHDKHPALIARCVNEGDVQNAVTFARERELLVAVRGGGHSWPGKSVCDGGIMIDLALMHDAVVDPSAQHATVQGGALLGSMSVAENIELPLRFHTRLDEKTIRIMTRMKLEVVNLAGFEDLMPSELSGGMLKRAALARAPQQDHLHGH